MEQGNSSKKMLEKIAPNGVWVFLFLIGITFLVNKILNWVWLNYAPLFFWGGYVVYILDNIFSKKREPILKLDKKVLIGYFLILPLIMIMILLGVYVFSILSIDKGGNISSVLCSVIQNDNQILVLTLIFFGFVIVNYFHGYEKEKNSCQQEGLMPPVTIEYMEKLHLDGEEGIRKIEQLASQFQQLEDVLKSKNAMCYTATCIPVKYDANNESIKFVLVKNESHQKSQWMFPGSHVEVSDNIFSNMELTDVAIIPSTVIRDKVKREAGLDNITFIDPNYKYVNPNAFLQAGQEEYQYPNTCWPVEAPIFNYLFKVSDSSNCYGEQAHRCHYDFTYVGEYEEVNSDNAKYDVIEMQFNLRSMKLKNEARRTDIAYIKTQLEDWINQRLRKTKNGKGKQLNIPLDELCLDSIPQMIYNTILFYKDYKGL